MTTIDRRALIGTLAAVGGAGAAFAAPAITPLENLKKEGDVACLYHCDFGDAPRFTQMLQNIANHYSAYGADPFGLQLVIVAHGQGVKFFLDDLAGTGWSEESGITDIFPRIADLAKSGLKVHLCNITFERLKLDRDKARKADWIGFVPSGVATVAALQTKGFAYLKVG